MGEQQQRRRFGPLQVVNHQHQRRSPAIDAPARHGLEHTPPLRLRIGRGRFRGQLQPRRQLRPQVHQVGAAATTIRANAASGHAANHGPNASITG